MNSLLRRFAFWLLAHLGVTLAPEAPAGTTPLFLPDRVWRLVPDAGRAAAECENLSGLQIVREVCPEPVHLERRDFSWYVGDEKSVSGAFRRHTVVSALSKQHPEATKRDIALALEVSIFNGAIPEKERGHEAIRH